MAITIEQIMDEIASNRLSAYDLKRIALLLPRDILEEVISLPEKPLHVAINEACNKLKM